MPRYIFFARTIKNVGGAQLYMNAKIAYLKKNGWEVSIIYNKDGDSFFPDMENCPNLLIDELDRQAYMYLSYKRKMILKQIIDFLGVLRQGDVIESHSLSLSSWAEMTAKHYGNVRHLIYELDERPRMPKEMVPFYKFKYERNELVGILDQSVALFLEGTGIQLTHGSPRLSAHGAAHCVLDVPNTLFLELEGQYVIGIVGRLEKPYVWEYAKSAAEFTSSHTSQMFTIVIIGGEPEGDIIRHRIEDLFATADNVKLIFTGYIFPIPSSLVSQFDICLAGAGAAKGISREGITTLPIDPRDFLCSGVIGLTTKDSVFSEGEKHPVAWWMNKVYCSPNEYKVPKKEIPYNFQVHIDYLSNCSGNLIYDVSFLDAKGLVLFGRKLLYSIVPVKFRAKMRKKHIK